MMPFSTLPIRHKTTWSNSLVQKMLWQGDRRWQVHTHDLPGKEICPGCLALPEPAAIPRIPCALDETGFPINHSMPGHRPARGADSGPKLSWVCHLEDTSRQAGTHPSFINDILGTWNWDETSFLCWQTFGEDLLCPRHCKNRAQHRLWLCWAHNLVSKVRSGFQKEEQSPSNSVECICPLVNHTTGKSSGWAEVCN